MSTTTVDAALDVLRDALVTDGARQAIALLEQIAAVAAALDDKPRSVGQIATTTGRNRSSVHRHLVALVEAGRAEQVRGGWVTVPIAPSEPASLPVNGPQCCPHCGRGLQPWGGRLYCMHAQCGGSPL